MEVATSWLVIASSSLIYGASVSFAMTMMKGKTPFGLVWPLRLYNLFQIVVCAYVSWGLWPSFPSIFGLDSEFTPLKEHFVFVHYLTKYLDFLDTAFIVLRCKNDQLSFLHLYHHSTIG